MDASTSMSKTERNSEASQVQLVIRFSSSNPDLLLSLSSSTISTTSIASLKEQIRSQLQAPASESRLRLIHSGRVLQDATAIDKSLGSALQQTPPPPSSDIAKGKLPVRDTGARVYIHCSIGDALSSADLAAETRAAKEADTLLASSTLSPTAISAAQPGPNDGTSTTTTPAPRGFDRLLSTGFTAAEVSQLRTQFLAIQSHTHTLDTMPTGPALLDLEEAWLDNSNGPAGSGNPGLGQEGGGFGSEDVGGLEDMLYGNLVGFFWPIGAICWLGREEGVWSQRRRIAVLSGFLVNITFGFLRLAN